MVAAIVAAALAGLTPALRGSRADLTAALKDDDGRSAGLASARLRAALLVGEAALAIVLVVGAGLLVRSVEALARVDSGYDPRNVLTAQVHLSGASTSNERRAALTEALLTRLRALPQVVSAGAGNMTPFGDSVFLAGVQTDAKGPGGEPVILRFAPNVVTYGFPEALGLRVVQGRTFTRTDTGAPVLVSETFARKFMQDGRPIVGRSLPLGRRDNAPPYTVIGVVADVRPFGPRTEPRADVYYLTSATDPISREINQVIRTTGDPHALAPTLRDIVRGEDRLAALDKVGPLSGRLSASVAQPRFFATVLTVFASLALLLAAIGLYGVLSYGVTLRRRELGIRAALGASRGNLLGIVVRQGLSATGAGLAIGLLLAIGAARAMRSLLFGIEPIDVPSFAAGAAILGVVALVACLVPARRAAASDPLEALRHE
jgi:predicted permease